MSDKQTQRAGDGANQIQVAGDLVQIIAGVDEQRATEIAREQAHAVLAEHSREGIAIGLARIEQFDELLIQALSRAETLAAVADPGFQILMRKAQIAAASTEHEADYEVLAGLLADRSTGPDRPRRAAIDRAVQIVEFLDDESLTGLTIFQSVAVLESNTNTLSEALDVLEGVYAQLHVAQLPEGDGWLEHLELLGAIRGTSQIHVGVRKFDDLYSKKQPGFFCQGVPESENETLLASLLAAGPPNVQVFAHDLRPGYLRGNLNKVQVLQDFAAQHGYSDEAVEAILAALKPSGFPEIHAECLEAFPALVAHRPVTNQIRTWWDQLPRSIELTPVGRAITAANARRLVPDRDIPLPT